MDHNFQLYWRRETGCDAGTPVALEDLDPVIQPRILQLAREMGEGPIAIRLPFLDRREWRRRAESLRAVKFVRDGQVIRHVPPNAGAALRDQAAETIGANPVWMAAPPEHARGYFRVWRNVSVALQEYLRRAVPAVYFRDAARYENRRLAWPLLVYQSMRPCRGISGTEFTYDVANPETLAEALRMIRRPLQEVLGAAQRQVAESGRTELSRRYAPLWDEDIVRAVMQNPRRLLALLGDEAALVDAVITLGGSKDLGMVKPFVRQAMTTLRSFYDCDLRELAMPLLAEATRALEETMQKQTEASVPVRRALGETTSRSPRVGTDRSFAAPDTSGRYRPGSGAFR
jgi:hypothetical protein